jgi:hypothetical protein
LGKARLLYSQRPPSQIGPWKTYTHTGSLSVRSCLALVADQNIDVGEDLLKLDLEELGDERCRQVKHDRLTRRARRLGDLEDGLDTVRKKVSLNVEELGARDKLGDIRCGQVGRSELLGSTQRGAQGPVVVCANDGTGAGLGGGGLDLVCGLNALGLVGLLEGSLQVVVTDRTDVGDGSVGKDVLRRQLSSPVIV